jgi:hypothetical protein
MLVSRPRSSLQLHRYFFCTLALHTISRYSPNRQYLVDAYPTPATMKGFITLFMAVLACLCLVPSANAWVPMKGSDRNTCGKKNPDVVNAIENFCFGNKNMVRISSQSWPSKDRPSLTCGRSFPPIKRETAHGLDRARFPSGSGVVSDRSLFA